MYGINKMKLPVLIMLIQNILKVFKKECAFDKNPTSFHDKTSKETKNRRNIPKLYKGYI
jgi:hypothetical protein